MARTKKFIQKSGISKPGHKGYLRHALGIKKGHTIPLSKLRRASHASGRLGHAARMALNMRGLKHRRGHRIKHASTR